MTGAPLAHLYIGSISQGYRHMFPLVQSYPISSADMSGVKCSTIKGFMMYGVYQLLSVLVVFPKDWLPRLNRRHVGGQDLL